MFGRLLGAVVVAAAFGGAVVMATAARSSSATAPRCFGKPATKIGTPRPDVLTGTRNPDVIVGLGGSDHINGLAGNDLLCGRAGDDVINGGFGTDRIDGGPGFDVCRGGEQLVSCEETAPALPLFGRIAPGRYTPDKFKPRFAVTLGADWFADEQTLLHVDVEYSSAPTAPDLDVDSSHAGIPTKEVVAAITAETGLNPTTPASVTIGTASGYEFDVSVPDTGQRVYVPDTVQYEFDPGDHGRIFVVSASGKTVVIISGTTSQNFSTGSAEIDTVLATVKWDS